MSPLLHPPGCYPNTDDLCRCKPLARGVTIAELLGPRDGKWPTWGYDLPGDVKRAARAVAEDQVRRVTQ